MRDSMGAGGRSTVDADSLAREDALDVLRDALEWQLTADRWKAVEQTVDALDTALVVGDTAAFREAVCYLERVGPIRATGFGQKPTVSAPDEPVRERINELIHSLEDPQSAGRRVRDDDAGTRE